MAPNDQAQKALQLAEVARTLPVGPLAEGTTFVPFSRWVAVVAGVTCEHGQRNGHMHQPSAIKCGKAMAEAEMSELPENVDIEAKHAAVAISLVAKPRFLGIKADGSKCGCTFGHKTQEQATACARGTRTGAAGMTRRSARASIPIAGVRSQAEQAAIQAAMAAQAKAEAEYKAIMANAQANPDTMATPAAPAQPAPKRNKLRSGAQGATSRA